MVKCLLPVCEANTRFFILVHIGSNLWPLHSKPAPSFPWLLHHSSLKVHCSHTSGKTCKAYVLVTKAHSVKRHDMFLFPQIFSFFHMSSSQFVWNPHLKPDDCFLWVKLVYVWLLMVGHFFNVLTVANSQCSWVNVKHINQLITWTHACGCDVLHNSVRPLVKPA
jgi:hypothetical protein